MTQTVQQTYNNVATKLDDPNFQRWKQPELLQYINEGLRNISREAEVLETVTSAQNNNLMIVQSNINKYLLPLDCLRPHKVEFNPTGQIQTYPISFRGVMEMDAVWGYNQTIQSAYPDYYTLWGYPSNLQIILYPVPSQGGTLNVYYYRMAKMMVLPQDILDIPDGWTDIVEYYVEKCALRKDADPRWQEADQIYRDEMMKLIDRSRTWTDDANVLTTDSVRPPWYMAAGNDF